MKMHEETSSDGFENFTAEITKWRDHSDQHTVEHALKFEMLTYMDLNMPSYCALILCLLFISLCRLWSCHIFLPHATTIYLTFLLGLYISLLAR